ncbi:putative jacalin-like lectin domain-containing protein [Helianthus annuus]|nr:putative jacalin-like lectin domain-containing protein [Helianthus annuus]
MLKISINYPLEYLISISWTFGSSYGYDVVKSLCFKTNVTSYGPYGTNSGTAFSYNSKGGMILGFHGRAHGYLTAIRVYVMPESLASATSSTYVGKIMPEVISLSSNMGLSRIELMTSWWKRGRFTTTPAFFLLLWCPPNCIYGVHIQFNIPNLLFFLKDWGSGTPVAPMWVRPC